MINQTEPSTVQLYISRPLLIDGFKFSLRVYVLIISVDPLRIYIYKEGILKLCAARYSPPNESNLEFTPMHLASFSTQSSAAPSYSSNSSSTTQDSTRTLSWLWNWLINRGHNKDKIWHDICDIVVKSIISIQSPVAQAGKTCKFKGNNKNPFSCFEVRSNNNNLICSLNSAYFPSQLLGFDFLISEQMKPYLISVNSSPSLNGSTDQETKIKVALVENTLSLLNMTIEERMRFNAFRGIESQIRLYGEAFDRKLRIAQNTTYELQLTKEGVDYVDLLDEKPSSYWKRFIANESKHIGNFELLYPANVHPSQVTAGKQEYYEKLLDLSDTIYRAATNGIFHGFMKRLDDHDDNEEEGGQEKKGDQADAEDGMKIAGHRTTDAYSGMLDSNDTSDKFLTALLEAEKREGKEIAVDDLFSSLHSSQPDDLKDRGDLFIDSPVERRLLPEVVISLAGSPPKTGFIEASLTGGNSVSPKFGQRLRPFSDVSRRPSRSRGDSRDTRASSRGSGGHQSDTSGTGDNNSNSKFPTLGYKPLIINSENDQNDSTHQKEIAHEKYFPEPPSSVEAQQAPRAASDEMKSTGLPPRRSSFSFHSKQRTLVVTPKSELVDET